MLYFKHILSFILFLKYLIFTFDTNNLNVNQNSNLYIDGLIMLTGIKILIELFHVNLGFYNLIVMI